MLDYLFLLISLDMFYLFQYMIILILYILIIAVQDIRRLDASYLLLLIIYYVFYVVMSIRYLYIYNLYIIKYAYR